jgi:hypothetical protein
MSNEANGTNGNGRAFWEQTERFLAAMNEGVRQALIRHKRMGWPIVVWRDGKTVTIPPEEIVVDESPAAAYRPRQPEGSPEAK